MPNLRLTLAFALTCGAAGASAQPAASNPEASAAAPLASSPAVTVAPVERMMCKRPGVTGSKIQQKRVCMTARNWALQEQNAPDSLQEITKHGAFSNN